VSLPNVRDEYNNSPYGDIWRSGTQILQNLEDDRKIRIETNQEDSEILYAGADTVLYRVNDVIYQAKILGDKLQNPSVVVKDDDVPEIHWVFWSTATDSSAATAVGAKLSVPSTPGGTSLDDKPAPSFLTPLNLPPMVIRLSGAVMEVSNIKKAPPDYPPEARQAHIQGDVVLHALIGIDGKVTKLAVVSGSPLLVRAVLGVFDDTYLLWTQKGGSRFGIKDNKEFTELLLQQAARKFTQIQASTDQDDGKEMCDGEILRVIWRNGVWFGFIKHGVDYENVYFDSRGYHGEARDLIPNRRLRFEIATSTKGQFAKNVILRD
jgi:hypothetical protein